MCVAPHVLVPHQTHAAAALPPTLLRSARPTAQAGRALLDAASRRVGGGVGWSDGGGADGLPRVGRACGRAAMLVGLRTCVALCEGGSRNPSKSLENVEIRERIQRSRLLHVSAMVCTKPRPCTWAAPAPLPRRSFFWRKGIHRGALRCMRVVPPAGDQLLWAAAGAIRRAHRGRAGRRAGRRAGCSVRAWLVRGTSPASEGFIIGLTSRVWVHVA